jgi:hypothetical protein
LKIESKTKTVQRIFLFLRSKLKVPGAIAIGTKQNENKYIMKELPQKNSSELGTFISLQCMVRCANTNISHARSTCLYSLGRELAE